MPEVGCPCELPVERETDPRQENVDRFRDPRLTYACKTKQRLKARHSDSLGVYASEAARRARNKADR